jgi:hypothetical protein
MRDRARTVAQKYRDAGLCATCGGEVAEKGRKNCPKCTRNNYIRMTKSRERAVIEHLKTLKRPLTPEEQKVIDQFGLNQAERMLFSDRKLQEYEKAFIASELLPGDIG